MQLLQAILVNIGDRFEIHEFSYVPYCDYNLLGRDLMAKLGMQINIVKSDDRANTVVTLHKLSAEASAKIDPEAWAVPGKYGKLEMEPLQITLKQPGQGFSKRQYLVSKDGRKGLQPIIDSLLKAGLLDPYISPYSTPIYPVEKRDGTYRIVWDL